MPNLSNLRESLKDGLASLRSDANVTIYSALSIVYIYQFFNYNAFIGKAISADYALAMLYASFISAIFFLILGGLLDRFFGRSFHLLWNLVGLFLIIPFLYPSDGLPSIILFSLLGGFSTSLALPGIISRVIGLTNFENRGSACGIFIFAVYALVFSTSLFINSMLNLAIILIAIKLISAILVLMQKPIAHESKDDGLMAPIKLQSKLSFLALWGVFLLVDALASNGALQLLPREALNIISLQAIALGLASMLIGGWLMDYYGRKKLMVYSYTYLVFEYALISLSNGGGIVYTFIDGIAWGILSVLFIAVVWGDIIRAKYRPLYISVAFSIAIASVFAKNYMSLAGIYLSIEQTFPATSVFLFLAVILTLFLPETLPEKIMQGKELKEYLEQAKRIREKFK